MTRGLLACLAIAFLALLAKTAGTYGVFAVARDFHEATTGNEVLRLSLTGDAARDLFRSRGIGAAYLAATLHLHVALLVVSALAFAAAVAGSRKAAAFLCLLVLVALPVDLPLGIVDLVHRYAGTGTGLPPEMTWSWVPRDPFAIMRRITEGGHPPGVPDGSLIVPGLFVILLVPGMLAATTVLAGLRGPRRDGEDEPLARPIAA